MKVSALSKQLSGSDLHFEALPRLCLDGMQMKEESFGSYDEFVMTALAAMMEMR